MKEEYKIDIKQQYINNSDSKEKQLAKKRTSSFSERGIFDDKYFKAKEILSEDNTYSFDKALTQTGFGKYQLIFYLIMVTLGMGEGSQISVFTLMIPILKQEWNVPDYLNSLSASVVFVGCLIGSLIAGQFADKIGRKKPFIFTTGLTAILTLLTAFSQNIYQLVILRGIIGILVGFFGPLGVTYTSEFTPAESRGRFMSIIQVSIAFGQLYGLFMGYLTLNSDLQSGNWRMLITTCSIPGILSWIGGYFFLDESALFYCANGEYDKCFQILERINHINGCPQIQNFDQQRREKLISWSKQHHNQAKNENASIRCLFKGKLSQLSGIVWMNWFSLSFVYYGIIIMMPYMLAQMPHTANGFIHNNIFMLGVQGVSDVIGASIASYLIEVPGFGRKNSMIFFFFLSGFVSALAYYYQGFNFAFLSLLDRFFLSMTFVFAYQYTSEIYPTNIRTTGIGMASAIGRVGGTIIPFISMYLAQINLFAPFLLYSIIGFSTAILDTTIEQDTLGKSLDSD